MFELHANVLAFLNITVIGGKSRKNHCCVWWNLFVSLFCPSTVVAHLWSCDLVIFQLFHLVLFHVLAPCFALFVFLSVLSVSFITEFGA